MSENIAGNNAMQLNSSNMYNNIAAFDFAARMAGMFAKSTIVPKDYQNQPSNCIIALELSNRLNMPPMMVMQNLHIIQGRPSWSAQFIVAMINASKKYKTELQYELKGSGDTLECYAYATDKNDRKVIGPVIDMKMAKAEGWLDKNGSKWKTMPEVMMRYRAASFFGRLNCPELVMGIYSDEEVIEMPSSDYREVKGGNSNVLPIEDLGEPVLELNTAQGNNQQPPQPSPKAENNDRTEPTPPVNNSPALICADCGAAIMQAEYDYSVSKYERPLCRKCQKTAKGGGSN
ncbi:MAG: recombinase RecT [Clostridiales bacterium]|jgi:hypothetical protein|nr:recombinase RecT [Clostridiales bacterium]